MAEHVEYILLRRVHDGEVSRVGDTYLWRSPGGHLRSHCHEPLDVLVVLGLLAQANPAPEPVAEAARPVVLTDAGRARLEQIAPPDAAEVTRYHVDGRCGHLVALRYDGWVAPCPTCNAPARDPGGGQASTPG